MGELAKCIDAYRTATELDPNEVYSRHVLAWLLATSEDARFRDGRRALEYAEAVVKIEPSSWICQASLAAAHAEVGDFDRAVVVQRKAIGLSPDLIAGHRALREQLSHYEQRKPYREPRSRAASVPLAPPPREVK